MTLTVIPTGTVLKIENQALQGLFLEIAQNGSKITVEASKTASDTVANTITQPAKYKVS